MSKRVRWAIYSGYEMDLNDFSTSIDNFPDMKQFLSIATNYDRMIVEYFVAYHRWRWHLPKLLKKHVPPILIIRALNDNNPHKHNPTPLEGRTCAFFFPVRCINHTSEEQFEEDHPDYTKHRIERETDQAKLDAFIEFVENRGGVLNRDMVQFSSMKERHPKVHPNLW